MNKKITRRVVLGTAIASLVARPFCNSVFAEKKNLKEVPSATLDKLPPPTPNLLPHGDMFDGWNTVRQRFQIPLPIANDVHKTVTFKHNLSRFRRIRKTAMSVPKTVTLKPDLSVSKQWNFLMLKTNVMGTAFQLEDYLATGGKGMYYETIEGVMKTGSEELVATVSNNTHYLISHKNGQPIRANTTITVNKDQQDSPFIVQATPKISDPVTLTYVLRDDVNGVDIPLLFMKDLSYQKADTPEKRQINWLTSNLSLALAYLFVTTDWAVGSQFVLPVQRAFTTGHWHSDTFTLRSLKNFDNKVVAEVVMEQSLDSKEQLRSYYQAIAQKRLQELLLKDFNRFSKEEIASFRQHMEKINETTIEVFLKQENYRYLKCTWHIDLVSGLVLRYESYRKNLEPNGSSEFNLFQMIES